MNPLYAFATQETVSGSAGMASSAQHSAGLVWCAPFLLLLVAIALFPVLPRLSHWWESNRNKLTVSLFLGSIVCVYYTVRPQGFAGSPPHLGAVREMLHHALASDYVPFIVLLFSLYTISGGIRLSGDIPAHPRTNVVFLALGTVLANFIGTTGASVLLIRPLLQVNSQRRNVRHTVIFFIFLVSNIGGSLLPIGDPPLFLGYLRGVPFLWTLRLLPMWVVTVLLLLAVYYCIERIAYRREKPIDIQIDERVRAPFALEGWHNFVFLAGVIAAVSFLVPGQRLVFTSWTIPDMYIREAVLLLLSGLSFAGTSRKIREANEFSFGPIGEVACLFVGIFVTMQVPIEILRAKGATIGMQSPMQYFWATGLLSSFLDNAPTYVVFFEMAGLNASAAGPLLENVTTATGHVSVSLLLAISAGAVFMGANTYVGNGPNFLVKSIAEQRGVRMPTFLGYMAYSSALLLPVYILVSFLFFR